GFKPETIVVSATHTHSGVGGYLDNPLAELLAMDLYREETEDRIANAVAQSIRDAVKGARPAALGFTTVRDDDGKGKPLIASNRRAGRVHGDEDDLDRDVQLLAVRDLQGKPIATLCCYAVHPTVLGTPNRYFSSDLVGPAEEAIARCAGGGEALFFNGAEGDVGPRKGSGGAVVCRAEGDAFAAVCSGALDRVTFSTSARFDGALGSRGFGDPSIYFTPGDRASFLAGDEGAGKFITAPLTLPVNLLVWILGFTNVRVAVTWTFSVGAVLDFSSYGDTSRFQGGGIRIRSGAEDVVLLAVPGEATHTVGLELKKRGRERGATRVFVLGLSDDAMSYIASRDEYFEGGYEATMTLFGPDTCEKLYDLERGILDSLYR
ncbi:MAG TPA: neutral/alkaline non-lysosomal ceramidase N-terminal domain-containing protein, partial [Planctomycetota bacterium]|nr:neutral/alkaline non-lysosomal ceramidase N-terminal domain-containing protein [Planctomycetota bacterium]